MRLCPVPFMITKPHGIDRESSSSRNTKVCAHRHILCIISSGGVIFCLSSNIYSGLLDRDTRVHIAPSDPLRHAALTRHRQNWTEELFRMSCMTLRHKAKLLLSLAPHWRVACVYTSFEFSAIAWRPQNGMNLLARKVSSMGISAVGPICNWLIWLADASSISSYVYNWYTYTGTNMSNLSVQISIRVANRSAVSPL